MINMTILVIKNNHLDLSGQIALIKKDQDPEDEALEEVREPWRVWPDQWEF